MESLIARHAAAFLRCREWDEDGDAVQVYVDEELHMHYPAAAYAVGGRLYIALAPFLAEGAEMLEDIGPESSAADIVSALMEGVEMIPDRSGFYTVDGDLLADAELPAGGTLRLLTGDDAPTLDELLAACTPMEREAGAVSAEDPLAVGCFAQDGRLAAAASFWYWDDAIADVTVVTHPACRGMGFGRAAVADLCRRGLADGRIIQYRCDDSNRGSVALCRSLGFVQSFSVEGVVLHYPEDEEE